MKYQEKLLKAIAESLGVGYSMDTSPIDFHEVDTIAGTFIVLSDEDPEMLGVPMTVEQAQEANKKIWLTAYPVANPLHNNKTKYNTWSQAWLTRRIVTEHSIRHEEIRAYKYSALLINSGSDKILLPALDVWPLGTMAKLGPRMAARVIDRPM